MLKLWISKLSEKYSVNVQDEKTGSEAKELEILNIPTLNAANEELKKLFENLSKLGYECNIV